MQHAPMEWFYRIFVDLIIMQFFIWLNSDLVRLIS